MFGRRRRRQKNYSEEVLNEIGKMLTDEGITHKIVGDFRMELIISGHFFHIYLYKENNRLSTAVFDFKSEYDYNWNQKEKEINFTGFESSVSGDAYVKQFIERLREKITEINFISVFSEAPEEFILKLRKKLGTTGKREHLDGILKVIKEKYKLETNDEINLEMAQSYPALYNVEWEDRRGIIIFLRQEGKFYRYDYLTGEMEPVDNYFG